MDAFWKQLHTPFGLANLAEAALWFAIAIVFALVATRKPMVRRRSHLAAIAFFAFGLSDLLEISTGAWWRPWPLLALKSTCVAVLIGLLIDHYRRQRE